MKQDHATAKYTYVPQKHRSRHCGQRSSRHSIAYSSVASSIYHTLRDQFAAITGSTITPILSTARSQSLLHNTQRTMSAADVQTPPRVTRSKAALANGSGLVSEPEQIPLSTTPESPAASLRHRRGLSNSSARSQESNYNGLPTLATVPDDTQEDGPSSPLSDGQPSRPPPPAASTLASQGRPVTRKRRSSSVKRKLSPGVVPTKAVDWEIPRKVFHSSIGFVTLGLWFCEPPTLVPLILVLSAGLVCVFVTDVLRLRFPAFAEVWEQYLGFLMRESERDKINGVVWYLIGVIFVLALYPRDVAVVAILT